MPQPKQGADIAPQVQVKTPTVTVITDGNQSQVLRVPKTHDEMNALIARRDQLSQQLEDVTDRRDNLIEQMRTVPGPAMIAADSQRLQRVEQGMEAMAIEIERISEGQRFTTKLLAEQQRRALGNTGTAPATPPVTDGKS